MTDCPRTPSGGTYVEATDGLLTHDQSVRKTALDAAVYWSYGFNVGRRTPGDPPLLKATEVLNVAAVFESYIEDGSMPSSPGGEG